MKAIYLLPGGLFVTMYLLLTGCTTLDTNCQVECSKCEDLKVNCDGSGKKAEGPPGLPVPM